MALRGLSFVELVTLIGFVVCLASFTTFGLSNLCSIDSAVSGTVLGFSTSGDLASWPPANLLNLLALTSFSLALTSFATFLAYLRARKPWLLASSGSVMLAVLVFMMPLFKVSTFVMHSVAKLCMERLSLGVDYGTIVYSGPVSCSHSEASSLSLISAFISSIATCCGVLTEWFESIARRYSSSPP